MEEGIIGRYILYSLLKKECLPAVQAVAGVGTTTKAGTDVAGRHPNPTHVSNQYRPGTTYNTAPVAADGAQLHGPPPPAYKEGRAELSLKPQSVLSGSI